MTANDWQWPDSQAPDLGHDSGHENEHKDADTGMHHRGTEHDDIAEFRAFCQSQELIRKNPDNETVLKQCAATKPGEFTQIDLVMIFSLCIMMCWGALVRVMLRRFRISIPYTVVLMLSGFGFGFLSKHYCEFLHPYTAIVRIHPEIILLTFLPILIFESAFSISVHTFSRSALSILLVAFPGMLISTFFTSGVCMYFFDVYNWTFPQSSLFGSVISATDPVAVVAVLRELGASESLSVMIEGESLLNDGVAVLLYEIFVEIVEEPELLADDLPLTLHILTKFCQIAIGGTVFGFVMGKIAVFCLNKVYNDPTGEIAITICSAYLTYFIGEEMLGVSGIMAVVALGLTLGSDRTCISPESEKPVHHFWEMLGYFANTALFLMVGILISEVALVDVTKTDVWYLVGLYFQLTFIRTAMLIMLSPLLSRMGYGLEWKDITVTAWGALRGAVGLCLALEINENPNLCDKHQLGPKILFHTAGIVLLTLVINATTTKKLMDVLNMTNISIGRASDMENAYYILMKTRKTTMAACKTDRFLVGSVWDVVASSTKIVNPYRDEIAKAIAEASRMFGKLISENTLGIPPSGRSNKVMQDPRIHIMAYQEVHEEARRRIVHMLKSACWKQYQQGIIHADAARALVKHCDQVEDTPLILVSITELSKNWEPGWLLTKISELGMNPKLKCLQKIFQKISQYFIIERIHLAYETSRGFVSAIDTVIKLIPLLPDTVETLQRFKNTLEKERMLTFQELGPLQKLQPGVVQAVKTRITCRTVLNQMRECISEIKQEGLIDHEEAVVLELELEKQLKEMSAKIPLSLTVAPPVSFIHQLSWISESDEALKTYLVENSIYMVFNYGDVIYTLDENSKGIFLLVSGLVKVEYSPSASIIDNFEQYGALPNTEVITDLTFRSKTSDILTQGALIGDIGFLKDLPRAASATCNSYVTAYYFSTTVLRAALNIFGDCEDRESLEGKIWRSWGLHVATALLQRSPAYFEWSLEKIKIHLEPSVVPIVDNFETFEIPDNVADVVVIEGIIQNYHTKEIYAAPCLIPRYCTHISWKSNPVTTNRFLMVAHEDVSKETLLRGEPFRRVRVKSAVTSLGSIDKFLHFNNKSRRDSKDLLSARQDARQRRRSIAISHVKPKPTTNFNEDSQNDRSGRRPSFSLLRVIPSVVLASKPMPRH